MKTTICHTTTRDHVLDKDQVAKIQILDKKIQAIKATTIKGTIIRKELANG